MKHLSTSIIFIPDNVYFSDYKQSPSIAASVRHINFQVYCQFEVNNDKYKPQTINYSTHLLVLDLSYLFNNLVRNNLRNPINPCYLSV